MAERVLTQRELNRAVLARQLLLERVNLPIPKAVDRIAAVQNQYAPNAYIRLWSCLEGFEREALTRALEQRRVAQGTLMRGTIHLVSAREYPLFAAGFRVGFIPWWRRIHKDHADEIDFEGAARALRKVLREGPRKRDELVEVLRPFAPRNLAWTGIEQSLHLVRVPPSGTWERRRADLFDAAVHWIDMPTVTPEEGIDHVIRRYLGGFGPASRKNIRSWSGIPLEVVDESVARLRLRRFVDEDRNELLDLPRAPLPDPETPAPVRFLPTWDAALLVHARRTGIMPEQYRPIIFNAKMPPSYPTFLVDGSVAGTWKFEQGRVELEPFERISRAVRRELDEEAERLAAFHA